MDDRVTIGTTIVDHLVLSVAAVVVGCALLLLAMKRMSRFGLPVGVVGGVLLGVGLVFVALTLHAMATGWD
jgi:hypothetical protein